MVSTKYYHLVREDWREGTIQYKNKEIFTIEIKNQDRGHDYIIPGILINYQGETTENGTKVSTIETITSNEERIDLAKHIKDMLKEMSKAEKINSAINIW